MSKSNSSTITAIAETLRSHPDIRLAILFGSVALGQERRESDVDVAVDTGRPLTTQEKMNLIGEMAVKTGRVIDLIDLRTAGEPVIGQILKHGIRILGSKALYAGLIHKHLLDTADFMPYRSRILRERRRAWTAR